MSGRPIPIGHPGYDVGPDVWMVEGVWERWATVIDL